MNRRIIYTALSAMLLHGAPSFSQPFAGIEYVDIANIKAAVGLHGDMNWNPASLNSACEYPKGSNKHVASATTLWMTGYDQQAQLHTSAQMYRQTGNDFWPGPLDATGELNMSTSTKWAKIWKVNFYDINSHLANSSHTTTNTPVAILEWPAKGNPYAKGNAGASLNIAKDMAPFVDVNSDGIYNPLDGDYPDIKGDQMLWWVFSDNGPTHDNTQTEPLEVEVHAKAYAYKRGTLLDNVVYYELGIANTSGWDYQAFTLGIYADMDLGYFGDDYIGFDSARRLGYVYNGNIIDGTGQMSAYGAAPPIAGFTLLNAPGDNGSNKAPTGSFMTFNNDNSASGNPQNASEYTYYMQSRFRDATHLKNDYAGSGVISTGRGAGPDALYLFDGDPADTSEWSECAAQNPPNDRRFVLATNQYTLQAKTTINLAFALVVTDTGADNTCTAIDIKPLKNVTDTAWKNYHNPPKTFVSVTAIEAGKALTVYPNPATDMLHITAPFQFNSAQADLQLYDVTGRRINTNYTVKGNGIKVDTRLLPPGMYNIVYRSGSVQQSGRFIKE